MKSFQFTKPTIEDVPTMVRWGKENHELWSSPRGDFYSEDGLSEWVLHPRYDVLFVARDGKRLVGMCLTNVMREWAYCSSLYVDPEYRSFGIGTQLLEKTCAALSEKNIFSLALVTDIHNTKTHEFYKKRSFLEGYRMIWLERLIKK